MAGRQADHGRRDRYEDSRGGRRSNNTRDRHYGSREDRRDYGDDRRDSRRGDRLDQRRSRSPQRRRSRSRDRVRDNRHRPSGDYYRDTRDPRDGRDGRDSRDRIEPDRSRASVNDRRDRHHRGRSRSPESSHRRNQSVSSTSSAKHQRSEHTSPKPSHAAPLSAEERKKREEEEKKQERLAKLEAWKAKKAAKDGDKKVPEQDKTLDTSKNILAEPNGNALFESKTSSPTPTNKDIAKGTASSQTLGTAKKLDLATPSVQNASQLAPDPLTRRSPAFPVTSAPDVPKPVKTLGKMSSFGLKAKTSVVEHKNNTLLMDEEDIKTRTLEKLPDYIPEEHPMLDLEDDEALGDLGSDDEEVAAARMAAAEKRRIEVTTGDVDMVDVEPVAETVSGPVQDMDMDDEIDPLDAFMMTLNPDEPHRPNQGETFFGDETEVNMEAVDTEDLLAPAIAKKKREVPVVDHSKVEYAPFKKNLYVEPSELQNLTPEEVADLRLELDDIKTKPTNIVAPVIKWGQMGLSRGSLEVIEQLGYTKPTPIQAQAIPVAESGLDMIAVAKTGSGKTLAFGIPMIRHILAQPDLSPRDGPIGLILAPTRELAVQIVRELRPFLKAANLKAACAYGGAPIKDQIGEIKRGGIHLLCATPGRLIDLLMSNSGRVLSFKRITFVVLDEADRMFDMGFEPQVTRIVGNIRPDRQTLLFSATFPKNITSLAKKVLHVPVEITVGGRSVVAPEITQIVKVVEPSQKINELLYHLGELYNTNEDAQTLVFVEQQNQAEELLSILMKRGYPCNSIHGAKDQIDRTDAINDFKNGIIPILIATSVAARGLDIPHLKLVVNFDCPTHLEDYVHRCGRTGRAGNTGTAITFVENPGQERFAVHIAKALKQSKVEVPPELQALVDKFMNEVKEGKQKWGHSLAGFTGKGLDKLDEEREREKMREKRAFKTGDEKDDDEEDDVVIPVAKKETPAPSAQTDSAPQQPAKNAPKMPQFGEIIVKKTERAPAVEGPLNPLDRVAQAAKGINARLGKKGTIHPGQPIDNKGPDAGLFHATIDINDFHQKARWAVTNRTNVAKILESTGVSITSKGVYYPDGKEPREGEQPKLYILVEGDTENVVTMAVRELQRLLRDAQNTAMENEGGRTATGRYSVV